MAVTFSGAASQNINFGDINGGIAHKLISFWIVRNDTARGTIFFKGNDPYTQGWAGSFEISSGAKLFFSNKFSGTQGLWRGSTSFVADTYHIAIQYNWSDVANNPRMWVNGVAETVTETSTPVGTNQEGSGNSFAIGDDFTADSNYAPNAKILNFLIHDLGSASDAYVDAMVADAYNSRLAIPNFNGLVFSPNLNSAAGLQTFDGATLSGTNYLRDTISGATGTPSGSPVGAADTYLNWK